jgi:glycerol kinase
MGFWSGPDELRSNWRQERLWEPHWDEQRRETAYAGWQKAVQRTLDWAEVS